MKAGEGVTPGTHPRTHSRQRGAGVTPKPGPWLDPLKYTPGKANAGAAFSNPENALHVRTHSVTTPPTFEGPPPCLRGKGESLLNEAQEKHLTSFHQR